MTRSVGKISMLLVLSLLFFACGDDDDSSGQSNDGGSTLTVFAASSLTDAFEDISVIYEEEHPDVTVRFNFLSSSDLATQIEQGAGADVFASADEANMQRLADGDLLGGEPEVMAGNRLTIVVPSDNPGKVDSLEDLENDELVLALCNPECPAGKYAAELFDNAELEVQADSEETDVRAVLTRVSLGEADAGIVYITDVVAAEDPVESVEISDDVNVTATYPIAVTAEAGDGASDFVELVLSAAGQDVLRDYSFIVE